MAREAKEIRGIMETAGIDKIYNVLAGRNYPGVLGVIPTIHGDITVQYGHSYYWVVEGKVPLATAKKLYALPLGKEKIRVTGHCGCPAPEGSFLEHYTPDGRKILSLEAKAQMDSYREKFGEDFTEYYDETKFVFKDLAPEDESFVDSYHIDSDVALMLFVKIIKQQIEADAFRRTDL